MTNPDGTPVDQRQRQPDARNGAAARGNQLGIELRRPHPVGRRVRDRQRAAGPLHAARARRRLRRRRSSRRSRSRSTASDITDVTVVLSPGATHHRHGHVPARRSRTPPISTQVRISAPSTDQSDFGPQPNARVDKDGRFTLSGVPAGSHLIRAGGNAARLVAEVGHRRRPRRHRHADRGPQRRDARRTSSSSFTDQAERDQRHGHRRAGRAVTDFTVLAFPTDSSLWRPQARQIMTARPDQNGQVPDSRPAAGRVLPGDRRSGRTGRVVRAGVSRRAPRRRRAGDARRRRRQDAGLQNQEVGIWNWSSSDSRSQC